MRKQTKVAVVVSAAALLAMGASMTSFAEPLKKGWVLEGDEWVFLDSYGDRVYGEWKKSVDGNYYWLDEETGVMATNRLVEDEDGDLYYVQADGTRKTNGWVSVDNEDDVEVKGEIPSSIWYYFGSNGKAYKGDSTKNGGYKKASINGDIHFFDVDGVMQFGWIDDYVNGEGKIETYYCGTEFDEGEGLESGVARKGWQYMETTDDMAAPGGDYAEEEWFYFGTNGKMVEANPGEMKASYIDGRYYSFDENGVMQDGWYKAGVASSADVATSAKAYAYSNGTLGSGWVKATDDADNVNWYYMVTVRAADSTAYRAVPFNAGENGYRAKYIGGKTYLFDKEGKMVTGLINIDGTEKKMADGVFDGVTYKEDFPKTGIFFFEKTGSNEGAMKTGKVSVVTDDVTDYYYMTSNGTALVNAMKDNYIYGKAGKMIQAEDGNAYQKINLSNHVTLGSKDKDGFYVINDANGKPALKTKSGEVIVSSNGKVRTSGTVKIDGDRYEISFNSTTKEYSFKLDNN